MVQTEMVPGANLVDQLVFVSAVILGSMERRKVGRKKPWFLKVNLKKSCITYWKTSFFEVFDKGLETNTEF